MQDDDDDDALVTSWEATFFLHLVQRKKTIVWGRSVRDYTQNKSTEHTRDTLFTFPLVNTQDPWPVVRRRGTPSGGRANRRHRGCTHRCGSTRCNFQRKRVWPWGSCVGRFPPAWADLLMRSPRVSADSLLYCCVRNTYPHIHHHYIFCVLVFVYLMQLSRTQFPTLPLPVFAFHHHSNYGPIPAPCFYSDISAVLLLVYSLLNCLLLIHLASLSIFLPPFLFSHSHFCVFHLCFLFISIISLLIMCALRTNEHADEAFLITQTMDRVKQVSVWHWASVCIVSLSFRDRSSLKIWGMCMSAHCEELCRSQISLKLLTDSPK